MLEYYWKSVTYKKIKILLVIIKCQVIGLGPLVSRQTLRKIRSELNKDFKEYIASLPEETTEERGLKELEHALDVIAKDFSSKVDILKKQIKDDVQQVGKGKYKSKSKKKRASQKRKSSKKINKRKINSTKSKKRRTPKIQSKTQE